MVPSVLGMHLPQVSYMDLAKSTNNFSPSNLIGKGAHGSVYRGFISHLKMDVAVKVFNLEMQGAERSFLVECQTLRSIKHRNLVSVLTACLSIDPRGNEFKAIVYEFMPKGNLDELIHSQRSNEHVAGHIILAQRLNIAIDMANALDYLHHSTKPPVVHCDLKPSNILLDDDMGAHIGDFGLAKLRNDCPSVSAGCSTSSVGFRGTIGYAAPGLHLTLIYNISLQSNLAWFQFHIS
jgi:serine/threonine protein kinase